MNYDFRALVELLQRALPRSLVRPPTHEARAMPEAPPGDMVVAHLHDELGRKGSHCDDRSVLHLLGPPGASPVNPGVAISFSSRLVSAGRS